MLFYLGYCDLVCLGEDDGKGNAAYAEPVDEFAVYFHGVVPDVY